MSCLECVALAVWKCAPRLLVDSVRGCVMGNRFLVKTVRRLRWKKNESYYASPLSFAAFRPPHIEEQDYSTRRETTHVAIGTGFHIQSSERK
jgi:hypothetical protein